MLCFAEFCITLHIILCASLTLHISGSGRLSVSWSKMFLKSSQFSLRKFNLFSGIVCVGWTGLIAEMSDGRCCKRGKGPAQVGKVRGPPDWQKLGPD